MNPLQAMNDKNEIEMHIYLTRFHTDCLTRFLLKYVRLCQKDAYDKTDLFGEMNVFFKHKPKVFVRRVEVILYILATRIAPFPFCPLHSSLIFGR